MSAVTVADILASHSPEVRRLAEDLRVLIRATIPDVVEKAYPGWHAVGYRHPEAGYVFGVFPFDDHVHLLFEHGARLGDPAGLLDGHHLGQVRYVRLVPGGELPVAEIGALLHSAVHVGALRAAKPRPPRPPRRGRG